MSVRQIQEELNKLSPEELAEVEKHLRVLRVITAPGFKDRLDEAHRRMDAGQKLTQEDFEARLEKRLNDASEG